MPSSPPHRALIAVLALGALALGAAVAWHYFAQDLALSHYDAKAHLVVARRVGDSLTPGWKQFGGVWLPLPHLLNALPVQVDAFYRTGASGTAISVASFAAAAACLALLILRVTGSRVAGLAAAGVFLSDPNVLYLQSTPMTEPLLLALLAAAVLAVVEWCREARLGDTWRPGAVVALACLTRYEAWPVSVLLLGLALLHVARGHGVRHAARGIGRIAAWPVAAALLFVVNSRVSTGAWFVTGGFYVPDNPAHGSPISALSQVWYGTVHLTGRWTVGLAVPGLLLALWWAHAAATRRRSLAVLALSLVATSALPFYAFVQGHPFRIRYMVALVLVVAVGVGYLVAVFPRRWLRVAAAALLLGVAVVERPPLDRTAPMLLEAQWDRPNARQRVRVTNCLARAFDRPRDKVLASMGSLAHYMQEMSLAGFRLDDFVHEGTDEIWPDTLNDPRRHVQWILFEEQAEGGDVLTQRRARYPEFVQGFVRVCSGGGVTLYQIERPGSVPLAEMIEEVDEFVDDGEPGPRDSEAEPGPS